MRSYQVFQNDSPATNPGNIEGQGPFTFIGVADCATPYGPVDARAVKGLGKNYNSVNEFLKACSENNLLAKAFIGSSADVSDEQKKAFPVVAPPIP